MAEDSNEETGDWYSCTAAKLKKKYGDFPLKITSDDEGAVSYYCELCRAQCTQLGSLATHVASTKHARKVAMLELQKLLPTETGDGFPIQCHYNGGYKNIYNCVSCRSTLAGLEAVEKHLYSAKHLEEKKKWDAANMPSNDRELYKILDTVNKSNSVLEKKGDGLFDTEDPVVSYNKKYAASLPQEPGPSTRGKIQPYDRTKYLRLIEPFLQHLSGSAINDKEDALLALSVVSLLLSKLKKYHAGDATVLPDLIQMEMHIKTAKAGHMLDELRGASEK